MLSFSHLQDSSSLKELQRLLYGVVEPVVASSGQVSSDQTDSDHQPAGEQRHFNLESIQFFTEQSDSENCLVRVSIHLLKSWSWNFSERVRDEWSLEERMAARRSSESEETADIPSLQEGAGFSHMTAAPWSLQITWDLPKSRASEQNVEMLICVELNDDDRWIVIYLSKVNKKCVCGRPWY